MRDKAVGRIAIFAIVGFLTSISGTGGASAATTSDQSPDAAIQKPISIHPSGRHSIHHGVRHAARGNTQKTKISSAGKANPSKDPNQQPDKVLANGSGMSAQADILAVPSSVANANAELIENPSDTAADVESTSTADQQDASYVVAADQINDIDLAATGLPDPKPVTVSMDQDDTDIAQTSLIGRIFIAMGGLLTIGSAVRLFVV